MVLTTRGNVTDAGTFFAIAKLAHIVELLTLMAFMKTTVLR